jgi:hypothetical protein
MAFSMTLPDAVLGDIASQLASRLPPDLHPFAGSLSIGETFELWRLANALEHDLSRAIVATDTLHHQIFAADRPVAFARSRPRPGVPGQFDVTQIFVSSLANDVADAIAFADQNEPLKSNGSTARLVRAHPFEVTALVFGTDSAAPVYVVAAPFTNAVVRRGVLTDATNFMVALRQERTIAGRRPSEQ